MLRVGVSAPPHIESAELAAEAEQLGFDHFWASDSQMLYADPYACLALAAERTRTIQLGTAVAVAGTRLAPVTANAIATINRIAPGRVVLGLGTGHTAMRAMGLKPTSAVAFADYVRVVRGLLDGQAVRYTHQGEERVIRFLNRDRDFIRLNPRIPMYIAASGPRSLRLTGHWADGRSVVGLGRNETQHEVRARLTQGATAAGRQLPSDFRQFGFGAISVLSAGEAIDSDRVIDQVGPTVIAAFRSAFERHRAGHHEPPPVIAERWADYVALINSSTPADDEIHLHLHEGHGTAMRDEERQFLTADILTELAIVGEPETVVSQLRREQEAGMTDFIIRLGFGHEREVMRQVASQVLPKLRGHSVTMRGATV